MRRNLISQFSPVIRRIGVTARLISRNTSVSIPVVRVTNSRGLAPTCFRYTSHKTSVSGTSPLTKRTSLAKRVSFITERHYWERGRLVRSEREARKSRRALAGGTPALQYLVIRPQIHSFIEMPDLIGVTIE